MAANQYSLQDFVSNLSEEWSHFVRNQSVLTTTATVLGFIVIFYFIIVTTLELFQGFRLYVLSQYCCKTDFVKKYGEWAVVSGATDGIGQAMAKELAGRGMSVVVIGRSGEKLARTKAMLEQVPNAGQVETVKIDLSDSSLDNFERIRAQIDPENRDIGVLINNAGSFPDKYARFNQHSINDIVSMVNLNVLATLHLTRMIMPGMVQRSKGLVFNISSGFGLVPIPYLSIYGATKAFVDYFSQQLRMEYSSHPIDIILLRPGPVCTNQLKSTSTMDEPSIVAPTPEAFAKSAINALSTRIPAYAGIMIHGFMLENLRFANKLNLTATVMKLMATSSAKNFQLSPVVKRNAIKSRVAVGCEDGANVDGEALTMKSNP